VACRVERRGGSTAGVGDACVSMATWSSDDSDVTTLTTSCGRNSGWLCEDDDDDDYDDEGASVVLAVGGANGSNRLGRAAVRRDGRIVHPKNPDRLFSGEVRCTQP